MLTETKYCAIVAGVSAGGITALKTILPCLPVDFNMPLIIVQHIGARSDSTWISIFAGQCKLKIKEAEEKEEIKPGIVYFAPPNYHLMIEKDFTFSLSIDERVNFARPSIDVLFESAADAYTDKLIGIVLTGSSSDGTKGLKRIKSKGGLAIVQDPGTAESSYMPSSAIDAVQVDYILDLMGIGNLLASFSGHNNAIRHL